MDDLIDVIEGNRKYIRCLYVYNKIDVLSMEEVDALARRPHSVTLSCYQMLGIDPLLQRMWDAMELCGGGGGSEAAAAAAASAAPDPAGGRAPALRGQAAGVHQEGRLQAGVRGAGDAVRDAGWRVYPPNSNSNINSWLPLITSPPQISHVPTLSPHPLVPQAPRWARSATSCTPA